MSKHDYEALKEYDSNNSLLFREENMYETLEKIVMEIEKKTIGNTDNHIYLYVSSDGTLYENEGDSVPEAAWRGEDKCIYKSLHGGSPEDSINNFLLNLYDGSIEEIIEQLKNNYFSLKEKESFNKWYEDECIDKGASDDIFEELNKNYSASFSCFVDDLITYEIDNMDWEILHETVDEVLSFISNNEMKLNFEKSVVSYFPLALEYASTRLKDDPEVVKAAVNNDGWALEYASTRLKDDPEVAEVAVEKDGNALKYASARLRDNPDIVIAAVKNHGYALEYASKRLRDDPEIVTTAVKNKGEALQFASERLQDDPEIVTVAISQSDGWALRYASERLKDDSGIVTAAVEKDGYALEYASERLKDDPEVVKTAVKQNGDALEFASERLKDDPEIVIAAINQSGGYALIYASERLQALGVNGIIELAKEQREIKEAKIDIRNKTIIKKPLSEQIKSAETVKGKFDIKNKRIVKDEVSL